VTSSRIKLKAGVSQNVIYRWIAILNATSRLSCRFRKLQLLSACLIGFVLIAPSAALILDCSYSVLNMWRMMNLYTCTGRILLLGDREVITDVTQNHMAGLNDSHVQSLSIQDPSLGFIPLGIGEFFVNLESLDMYSSNVEVILHEHLQGLRNLKQLRFNDNRVRIIDSNLFIDNPLMFAISFTNNPIRHVGANVFDATPGLTSLKFDGSACLNKGVEDSRKNVTDLIYELFVYCPPSFNQVEDKILTGYQFQRQLEASLDPVLLALAEAEARVTNLEARIWAIENPPTLPPPPPEM
jgi:hypothetical protein